MKKPQREVAGFFCFIRVVNDLQEIVEKGIIRKMRTDIPM